MLDSCFRFKHDKGETFQRVEVEPPEDMDKTDYDVDPRMRIWKSMRAGKLDKQPERPRDGLDELHLPSLSEINIVQIQKVDPHSDISIKSLQEDAKFKAVGGEDGIDRLVVKLPEPDMDEIYHKMRKGKEAAGHLGPIVAKNNHNAALEINVDQTRKTVHLEPEEDMDDIYHRDTFNLGLHQVDTKAAAASVHMPTQRRHSEPEKDMDSIYHRNTFIPAFHQEDTKPAAAFVHKPPQKRHTQPEQDLDAVYHR